MDHIENLKSSIENWSKIVHANREQKITAALFTAIIESIEISDRLVNWILGTTGLTLALIVGNMHSLNQKIEETDIKIFILLLLGSGLFGFTSKAFSYFVNIYRCTLKEVSKLTLPIAEEYQADLKKIAETAKPFVQPPNNQLNFELIKNTLAEPFCWLERKILISSFEKGFKDPLYSFKKAVRLYRWHGYSLAIQIIVLARAFYSLINSL